jgi:hypothetical protein
MKKVITFFFLLILLSNLTSAQTPLAIPYQAVARTASGNLISNQLISVRFTILDGNASGTVVYKEKHTPTTNALGLFSVDIGTGTVISGTMASINWGINSKFLQVELDTTGSNSFVDMGTTQLMSVPYALHAKTVDKDKGGKTYLILTGDITNIQADSIIKNNVGPNTQFVKIFNTTNLTSVDLSGCIELVKLEITNNTALSNIILTNIKSIQELVSINLNSNLPSISFPDLSLFSGELRIDNNGSLASIEFGSLMSFGGSLNINSNNSLTSVNLGSLQYLNKEGFISISSQSQFPYCSINLSKLTTIAGTLEFPSGNIETIDLNNLTSITGNFIIGNLNSLTFLNLDNLTSISGDHSSVTIRETGLTSLNFNSLNSVNSQFGKIVVTNNHNLASINLPVIAFFGINNEFIFSSNALTSTSVNNLLGKFVSAPANTSIYLYLENQNPSAPPTGQGIIDKNTINSNGNGAFTD